MYARERRVLLRHYLEQGLTKAEIARSLKVCRRTVYHWIAAKCDVATTLTAFPPNADGSLTNGQ
jgi:transposase